MRLDVIGELAERLGLRIDRALEGTDRHFVVVAGVDQQNLGIGDQRVPIPRLDVGTDPLIGIDTGYAQRDDLLLQLHLGAIERLFVAVGFLVVDVSQARVAAKPVEQRIDRLAGAGYRTVDALLRQQQGALDAVFGKRREERVTQGDVVRQRYELVKRCHNDFSCHGVFHQWSPA